VSKVSTSKLPADDTESETYTAPRPGSYLGFSALTLAAGDRGTRDLNCQDAKDAKERRLDAARLPFYETAALALVVQKYGGTSVGSLERMQNVARRALETQKKGHDVVVIVSAMSGETNRLLKLAHEMAKIPDARELDALASTGEQVSAALVSLAIQELGGSARSLLGHQVRILTDSAFTKARIRAIDGEKIFETVKRGEIAVIAGFQGVDDDGNITTLGRGGSDTTAVAIAAAIKADACEIYTDVDGVYTTDPNICPTARKIGRISYEEMLELASLGAKVLQIRSVELAMKYEVPVHVRTSFNDSEGTWVVKEERSLEEVTVTGVAYDKSEAKVQLLAVPDKPGVVAQIFGELSEKNISVDMIIQNTSYDYVEGGATDVTFTVSKTDLARVRESLDGLVKKVGGKGVQLDEDICKVSIVGLGMRSHAGVASKMFKLLAGEGINIQAISTSEIKISCIIQTKYTELAVRALHDGFGLDKPSSREQKGETGTPG
jgi:aspartate kinase